MKTGLTISAITHAAVLLWAMVSFAPKALNSPQAESMPVDIVSAAEFSQMRAGARKAPKTDAPKPVVEKIAEKKPIENLLAKIVEKPQEITASALVPPPAPEKTPESKPDPKPKSAESPKPDPIAEALKKEQKSEPKKEAKPATKKQDVKPQPKFDADRIAALLDKRQPQRVAAAGDAINRTLAFGAMTGTAERLSQSELDALRAKLRECWNPPAGAPNAEKLKVPILIRFKQDGTLAAPPQPETAASDPFSRAMIDSAVRATIRCQPYSMLSPTKYDVWKEIVVDFSLDGMFGG